MWKQWPKDKKGPAIQQSLDFTNKDTANYHAGLKQDDKFAEDIKVIKRKM